LRDLFQLFFRSRGRNFLLACCAAVFWWGCCYWLYLWLQRVSPWHNRGRTWTVRLVDIGYIVVTVLAAVSLFHLVLYLLDDWVLLALSLLFLVGLVWTSRTMLPRFLSMVMLLLNLGTVREGERVLYHSVPW
jgi:hypothetical protein